MEEPESKIIVNTDNERIPLAAMTANKIHAKLSKLFARLSESSYVDITKDYLNYLSAHPTTQDIIVKAHRNFLTQFLQDNSQKQFFQKWFGLEASSIKLRIIQIIY